MVYNRLGKHRMSTEHTDHSGASPELPKQKDNRLPPEEIRNFYISEREPSKQATADLNRITDQLDTKVMYQQGVIDHLHMWQRSVNYKLLDLEARSRTMNVIFHRIPFHRNENCFTAVRDYLYYDLGMSYETVDNMQFNRAHRLNGSYNGGSAPPMIVFHSW